MIFATKENLESLYKHLASRWDIQNSPYSLFPAIHNPLSRPNPLKMVNCFHVYTRYCQTNRPQHILKCGQIFMNHALILNRIIFLSTLSKQQSTLSIQSGHNPSERVLFHLSQSVFRKLQSLGLQSEYHNDP